MNIIATLVIVLCSPSGDCELHGTASWQSFGPDAQYACNFVAASLPDDLRATCVIETE